LGKDRIRSLKTQSVSVVYINCLARISALARRIIASDAVKIGDPGFPEIAIPRNY